MLALELPFPLLLLEQLGLLEVVRVPSTDNFILDFEMEDHGSIVGGGWCSPIRCATGQLKSMRWFMMW